ncbi:MAG: hypothetical protein JO147_14275 [Actinobacteria bacterium]|nr:hypothetical protein [Actinomycetota bacterium]
MSGTLLLMIGGGWIAVSAVTAVLICLAGRDLTPLPAAAVVGALTLSDKQTRSTRSTRSAQPAASSIARASARCAVSATTYRAVGRRTARMHSRLRPSRISRP